MVIFNLSVCKIWSLLKLLEKTTRVLACSYSKIFFPHAGILEFGSIKLNLVPRGRDTFGQRRGWQKGALGTVAFSLFSRCVHSVWSEPLSVHPLTHVKPFDVFWHQTRPSWLSLAPFWMEVSARLFGAFQWIQITAQGKFTKFSLLTIFVFFSRHAARKTNHYSCSQRRFVTP